MVFNFALFMDVSILVLLAATVLLAFKLTISLKHFKDSRSEMEGLVNRLTANIDKAEKAVAGMQNAARTTGRELDEIITESKALRDELKLMNETGNNLANRLEKLAERNREFVDKIEEAGGVSSVSSSYQEPATKQSKRVVTDFDSAEELVTGFAIHDREYDDLGVDDDDLDFGPETGNFQSQAERELFEALQNSKSRPRKMGGTTQ